MKVLVLCHRDLVPPKNVRSAVRADTAPWRTELYVARSLRRQGAIVEFCGVDQSLDVLDKSILKFRPDVVFNLLEEFCGEGLLEPFIVSYLEGIGVPFTGSGSEGLLLAKNKLAAKVLIRAAGVTVPGDKTYPKIVKFIDEESSRGITERSVVYNARQEQARRRALGSYALSRVFSEEFVEGRELHVGVLFKGGRPMVTPIWETDFGLKPGQNIISEQVKWDFQYRRKMRIRLLLVRDVPQRVQRRIRKAAIASCRALGVTSYARIDIRLRGAGEVFVLEVNPNPDLARGDEFANCAESLGLHYDNLIDLIVREAICSGKTSRSRA